MQDFLDIRIITKFEVLKSDVQCIESTRGVSEVTAAKIANCKPSQSAHLENQGMRAFFPFQRERETHRPMSMFCVWPGMST